MRRSSRPWASCAHGDNPCAFFVRKEGRMSGSENPAPTTFAKFSRTVEGDKPAVLRRALDAFNGKPFINVRVWTLGPAGKKFPTKRGITIREQEIDAVIDALSKARDEIRRRT